MTSKLRLTGTKRGGIVAFTWHRNAPKGLEVNGREWWSGFYTDATNFDIAAALADPKLRGLSANSAGY